MIDEAHFERLLGDLASRFVKLPALRERDGDLPTLVHHFVDRGNKRLGRHVTRVPQEAIEQLESHDWPGNVRELQNVVDRALILSSGDTLELDRAFVADKHSPDASTASSNESATAAKTLKKMFRDFPIDPPAAY